MLTFKNTTIVFVAMLVLLIGLHVLAGLPLYTLLLPVIIYSLIVFHGSYYINSNFFLEVTCKGNSNEKKIALSFDDGPAAGTPAILETLKHNNIKAAFFCIGNRFAGNENILKQVHSDGHIIGNHSYSHHYLFDFFSSKKMLHDLQQMDESLQRVLPLKPKFFRPPYGVTTPGMKKALLNGNYIPVGWNIRSMDTVIKDEKRLFQKVTTAIKPGAIILFHDTGKATLAVLPGVIRYAWDNGYEFVRLDELINKEAYA
jgi:peptidoglycan/xylan/chitin deacetylase (PgdA/CDA1 family)